jgi:hypothetical protein
VPASRRGAGNRHRWPNSNRCSGLWSEVSRQPAVKFSWGGDFAAPLVMLESGATARPSL